MLMFMNIEQRFMTLSKGEQLFLPIILSFKLCGMNLIIIKTFQADSATDSSMFKKMVE